MIGVEENSASSPSKTATNSCLLTCQILITICIVIALLPFILNWASVFIHRIQWNSQSISHYTLTLIPAGISIWGQGLHPNGTTIIVRDGNVVEVMNAPTELNLEMAFYQKYTIYGMFDQANNCVILCSVQYNSTYGFPERIGGGFIEGGWFEVTDFEIDTP